MSESRREFIPGRNGGRLRNGGTNKGGPGRPPDAIRTRCAGLFDAHVDKAVTILKDSTASHGDKLKALDLLGRYGGLLKQTTEMQGTTIADLLREIAETEAGAPLDVD